MPAGPALLIAWCLLVAGCGGSADPAELLARGEALLADGDVVARDDRIEERGAGRAGTIRTRALRLAVRISPQRRGRRR